MHCAPNGTRILVNFYRLIYKKPKKEGFDLVLSLDPPNQVYR